MQIYESSPLSTGSSMSAHTIVEKRNLSPQVKQVKIYAPEIADKAKAGQFVILRTDSEGERIPLTLVSWDKTKGTITLIFQEVGVSTQKLGALQIGEQIPNLIGPLGNPSDIKHYGLVAVVCGGVGTAAAYPIAKALKEAGNRVVSIVGARTSNLLILQDEMKHVSDEYYISTDDGSQGQKGFVSDALKSLIEKKYQFKVVYVIGPPMMMKVTSEVTRPYSIKTVVSLNPIMVDGIGMCGACRVTVGGQTKFACVDGPEFDAHQTNFDELIKRLKVYPPEEKQAVEFHEHHGGGSCTCYNHK
jgi:ferredoxin--NADP+ reductase